MKKGNLLREFLWAPCLQRIKEKSELNEKLVFEKAGFLSEELKTIDQYVNLTYQ